MVTEGEGMKRKELAQVHSDVLKAAAYFRQHRDEIRSSYAGQFVALLDGQIIASDEDYARLEKLVSKTCPGRHPYLVYANSLALSEMLKRFRIEEPITPASRDAWEEAAAEELIHRMQNG